MLRASRVHSGDALPAAEGTAVASRSQRPVWPANGLQGLCRPSHARISVRAAAEVPRRSEDRHIAERNLDPFAGSGVEVRAGLAVLHLEGAEAPELDVAAAHPARSSQRQGKASTTRPRSLLVPRGPPASAACPTALAVDKQRLSC